MLPHCGIIPQVLIIIIVYAGFLRTIPPISINFLVWRTFLNFSVLFLFCINTSRPLSLQNVNNCWPWRTFSIRFFCYFSISRSYSKVTSLKKKWSNMFYTTNYFICGLNDIRQIFLDIFFLIAQILSMSNVHNSSAMEEKIWDAW